MCTVEVAPIGYVQTTAKKCLIIQIIKKIPSELESLNFLHTQDIINYYLNTSLNHLFYYGSLLNHFFDIKNCSIAL
jgi:hypothetical protein